MTFWTTEYQCMPTHGDVATERAADHAWLTYYIECENYDRVRCSGPIDSGGTRLPATGEEYVAINRHASERLQATMLALSEAGVGPDLSERARVWASRLSYERAKDTLAHLERLTREETAL